MKLIFTVKTVEKCTSKDSRVLLSPPPGVQGKIVMNVPTEDAEVFRQSQTVEVEFTGKEPRKQVEEEPAQEEVEEDSESQEDTGSSEEVDEGLGSEEEPETEPEE